MALCWEDMAKLSPEPARKAACHMRADSSFRRRDLGRLRSELKPTRLGTKGEQRLNPPCRRFPGRQTCTERETACASRGWFSISWDSIRSAQGSPKWKQKRLSRQFICTTQPKIFWLFPPPPSHCGQGPSGDVSCGCWHCINTRQLENTSHLQPSRGATESTQARGHTFLPMPLGPYSHRERRAMLNLEMHPRPAGQRPGL